MKKFTALFLTFVLLFSFASCRENSIEIPTTTSTVSETTSVFTSVSENVSESTAESVPLNTTKKLTETVTTEKKNTSSTSVKTTAENLTETITTTVKRTRKTTTRRDYSLYTSSTSAAETTQLIPTTEETTTRRRRTTTTETETTVKETETSTASPGYTYTPAATTAAVSTCTITINCSEILNNMNKLKSGKESFIPAGGEILRPVTIIFKNGETVFDILKRACQDNVCSDNCQYCQNGGIQLEYEFTPGYDNYYIEGIHQIYEKDCGSKSGWMYKVNGVFPNYGCSDYTVKNGDKIEFVYTCDLGEDLGAEF